MPLYECSKCSTIDNTALTGFWWEVMHKGHPALCSACDPEIKEWHGQFDRLTRSEFENKYGKGEIEYTIEKVKPLLVGRNQAPRSQNAHGGQSKSA